MENINMTNMTKNVLGKENANSRKTAKIVGYLFILATAITFVAIIFMFPLLGETIDPIVVAENQGSMAISMVCWMILAASVAGIGIYMYPVLKESNKTLAASYGIFRILETVFILIAIIYIMDIVALSQDYVSSGTDTALFVAQSSELMGHYDLAFRIGTMIFLGLGGLVIYYQVHRAGLVPRWLAGWGFIGAAMVFVYGVATFFGYDPAIMSLPIAVQEMVFAVWLIAKGFNASNTISESQVE